MLPWGRIFLLSRAVAACAGYLAFSALAHPALADTRAPAGWRPQRTENELIFRAETGDEIRFHTGEPAGDDPVRWFVERLRKRTPKVRREAFGPVRTPDEGLWMAQAAGKRSGTPVRVYALACVAPDGRIRFAELLAAHASAHRSLDDAEHLMRDACGLPARSSFDLWPWQAGRSG